jgi:hypothetical protein
VNKLLNSSMKSDSVSVTQMSLEPFTLKGWLIRPRSLSPFLNKAL